MVRRRRLAFEVVGAAVVAGGLLVAVQHFGADRLTALRIAAIAATTLTYAGAALVTPAAGRRLTVYLATVSALLASLLVVATAYRASGDAILLVGGAAAIGASVLSTAAVALVLFRVALAGVAILARLIRRRFMQMIGTGRPIKFGYLLLALAVLWLPTLLTLLPGTTTYDGARQIDEWIGASVPSLDFTYFPTNHHPWFATIWQGALLNVGLTISGGDINVGLMVHTAVLVAASLLTYAAAAYRVQRLAGRGAAVVMIAVVGLIPHFANYAVLFEKTGWYQLALIWFVLGIVASVHGDAWWRVVLQLGLGGLLTALFRSNGLYVVLGSLAVLVLVLLIRRHRRRAISAASAGIAALLLAQAWSGFALPAIGVMPASPAEALNAPFQQVARIVREHGDELTGEQRAAIDPVLPLDQLGATYQPENADPVKALYHVDSFLITDTAINRMRANFDWWQRENATADLRPFLATWAQLVTQYPATALSATVQNNYIYFAPPFNRGDDISLFTGGLPDYFVLANEYTTDYDAFAEPEAQQMLRGAYGAWATTPGLNMLVNPGLYGWLVIALGVSLMFWRRSYRLALWAPIAFVYLINFAGARNGDFRYTVPLVALIPIVLAAWWSAGRDTDQSSQAVS